jgi:hypothetical protein
MVCLLMLVSRYRCSPPPNSLHIHHFLPSGALWSFRAAVAIPDNMESVIAWLMNWKGCDGRKSWPNRDELPAFAWMDWGKSSKTTMKIPVVPVPELSPSRIQVLISHILGPHFYPESGGSRFPETRLHGRRQKDNNFRSLYLLRINTSHMTYSLCVHFIHFLYRTHKN